MQREAVLAGGAVLISAALFGIGTPLAKVLLSGIEPVFLAGLLYLGAGIGVALYSQARNLCISSRTPRQAPLSRADLPALAGMILTGGVAAPIILMVSLATVPAENASLLLNFEAAFTVILAALLFGEAVGGRVFAAAGAITAGGILLSWDPAASTGIAAGAVGIVVACACWGLDNNLTCTISAKDPVTITAIKCFWAGAFSLLLAFILGEVLPVPGFLVGAMVLGFFSYGVSMMLFIRALRSLGAARTAALFATAPFFGAIFSLLIFQTIADLFFWTAALCMAAGALLILRERHCHWHIHCAVVHDHLHRHDDLHHAHGHDGDAEEIEHSHPHVHEEEGHTHPHEPDIHHRHEEH